MLIIFPATTLYQGIPALDAINRVVTVGIMFLIAMNFLLEKVRILDLIFIVLVIILSIICVVYTDGKPYSSTPITTYFFWVVYLCYLAGNYKTLMIEMVSNLRILKGVTIFWEISVFVSMFLPICYRSNWGGTYFISFTSGYHRFAMTCFVILAYVYILIQLTYDKRYYLYFIIPLVGLLMAGARTYVAIGLLFIVAVYYLECKNKQLFYLSIIPISIILVLGIVISPVGNKFIDSFKGETILGYWGTLTNGRSIFWVEDLQGYWGLSLWKKLVGNGVNFVYDLNMQGTIKALIWAHNDVINLLCTNGFLGVILYFAVFIYFVAEQRNKQYKNTFIPMFAFYFTLGFNAMFNMLYTYTSAAIAIPFMLFSLYTLPNELSTYRKYV